MQRDFIKYDNIFDYYIIEEDELGNFGSTSIVKKAINQLDSEVYGVKIINLSEYKFEFVKNEIEILKELNHPNIVKLYEAYVNFEVGYIFIVFEWMEGGEVRLHNILIYN
jgi:calcium-dependent protein kinase